MDKFIGFDIDHKHTVACVVQAGQPDRYRKLPTNVDQLREWLKTQRGPARFIGFPSYQISSRNHIRTNRSSQAK